MTKTPLSNRNKPEITIITALITGLMLVSGLLGCGGSSSPPLPSLSINSPSVTEGDGGNAEMVFTVTLSEAAASTLTVDYTTVDDTATVADNDYTAVNGSITIPQGSSSANISVFVNGDTGFEAGETFNLALSNPQGLAISQTSLTAQGTITNDDNAEPNGYFTGLANVDTSTTIPDLSGLIFGNRILMFSRTGLNNVLYDISISNINLNNFSATANVYVNGDINDAQSQTNVSLTVTTDESTITGTFSGGSGLADGSFELTFDQTNNIAATIARIDLTGAFLWQGNIFGVDSDPVGRFTVDSAGSYLGTDQTSPTRCIYTDNLAIPSGNLNIYQLAHDVTDRTSCEYLSSGHTGYASIINLNSEETLVYAFSNGTFSLFAVMTVN